jgi:Trypsin-like peptidase domain
MGAGACLQTAAGGSMSEKRFELLRYSLLVGALCGVALLLLMMTSGSRASASAPTGLTAYVTSTFPIATEASFEVPGRGARTVTLEGVGTVLFDRYVLTVAHAVSRERLEAGFQAAVREIGLPVTLRRFPETTTYLLLPSGRAPLAPLVRNEEVDVALFELPPDTGAPPLPCAIGDSDALRLGAPVLLVERDVLAGPLVRPAAVAALRGSRKMASLAPSGQTFILTLGLVAGESGSPLLLSDERSCELVGLAQGTYVGPRQLAWGIRLREALEALSRSAGQDRLPGFFEAVCGSAVRPESFSFCAAR